MCSSGRVSLREPPLNTALDLMRFVAVVLAVLSSGCATFISKDLQISSVNRSQAGHIYSGVTYGAISIKCLWVMPFHIKKEGDSPRLWYLPLSLVGTAVYLFDVPFSFTADTLLIPWDLKTTPTNERLSLGQSCYPSEGAE